MPSAVELVRGGEACGPRAHDCNALAGAGGRRARDDPPLGEGAVDDGDFDALDGHWVRVDAEHARTLARRGAHAAGELGEVVREGELVVRLAPAAAVHEVVPLRNDVADGAARPALAERHAAVHAARRLLAHVRLRCGLRNLLPVAQALGGVAQLRLFAVVQHEPMQLVQRAVVLLVRGRSRRTRGSNRARSLHSAAGGGGLLLLCRVEHPLVVDGHDAHKLAQRRRPRREKLGGDSRPREARVLGDRLAQPLGLRRVLDPPELHELHVAAEVARAVKHIRNAAAHASRKVATGGAEDHCAPARHVLAAVVAHTLAHGRGTRVAHAEALRRDAADERATARGAVEAHVTHNDVVLRDKPGGIRAGANNDRATGKALADVVVRVAVEFDRDALREERAERLARRARELDADRVVGEAGLAVRLGYLVAQRRPNHAVHVRHRQRNLRARLAAVRNRLTRARNDVVVEARGCVEAVVLLCDAVRRGALAQGVRGREHGREVEVAHLLRASLRVGPEEVRAADHLVDGAEAQPRHVLPRLLRDHEEKVDHVLRLPLKLLAQHGVLRRNAHGARVEVALAHHRAPERNQRRRRKAKLLRAEKRRQHDVAPRAQLAVRLQDDAPAQVVQDERLVRLGEAQLPRQPRVLDARPAARARATVVAADQNVVGVALCNASRDDADAGLRHELDGDTRDGVRTLEVKDQLREILDRIDVVVGRRGDEAHARRRVARLGDAVDDLVAGEFASLAGLRALRHLDLQLVRVRQVPNRHAKAAARDLLDRRAQVGAVAGRPGIARGVLAALARVALPADRVHRRRERRVRFERNRTVAHRTRHKPPHNRLRGLHFLDGNGLQLRRVKLKQAAQRAVADGQLLRARKVVVRALVLPAHSVLQVRDRRRAVHVLLAPVAPVVVAGVREHRGRHRRVRARVREVVPRERLPRNYRKVDAADARRRPRKAPVHHLAPNADGLEYLRALVPLQRRNAHLGHHLEHARLHRLDVVLLGDLRRQSLGHLRAPLRDDALGNFVHEVRAHGVRAKPNQRAVVVHLSRLTRLDNKADLEALLVPHKVLVDGAEHHKRTRGRSIGRHIRVRKHGKLVAARNRRRDLAARALDDLHVAMLTGRARKRNVHHLCLPPGHVLVDGLDRGEVLAREDGLLQHEPPRLPRRSLKHVRHGSHRAPQGHDDGLAEGIDRRVRHLRKVLLEVLGHDARGGREARERRVVAHRAQRLLARLEHRLKKHGHVLDRVAVLRKARVRHKLARGSGRRGRCVRLGYFLEGNGLGVDPLAVGVARGDLLLEGCVSDNPHVLCVDT
eukprot:Opistho-1_new@6558